MAGESTWCRSNCVTRGGGNTFHWCMRKVFAFLGTGPCASSWVLNTFKSGCVLAWFYLGSGEGARISTEAVESLIHCRLAWGEQLVGSTSHTKGY